MDNRTFYIYGGLFLLLVGIQVAIFVGQGSSALSSSIECRATNAGLPLDAEDVVVQVYGASRPDRLVGEGRIGEALEVPPGGYDVHVLFARTQDQHAVWLRKIKVGPGDRVVREVIFAAGELSVEALVGDAAADAGEVLIYVFRPEDHDEIVTSMPSGRRVLLAAGTYDLRVVLVVESAEKAVRWLHDVEVNGAVHTSREVAFERGGLNVKATNAGKPLPPGAVELVIYRAGDVQQDVVDEGFAGAPLGLATGRYDVKVTYSASSDQAARWLRGLEIEESETIERLVDFSSGTVEVSAEIAGGGPVDEFHVYVYYYRAGDHRQPITYTSAGRPVVVESGGYDARASFFRSHDQPDIWLRDLVVGAGETVRRTVRFPSGRLLVRAYDVEGTELIGDNVFVYLHAAGQREKPIASARSGEIVTLTEGSYDARLEDTRRPGAERWLEGVRIRPGELREESVTLGRESGAVR